MSPGNERRPGVGTEAATSFAGDTNSLPARDTVTAAVAPSQTRACAHLRTRYCRKCRIIRHRDVLEADALTGRERATVRPESFGLDPDELRAHARDLWRSGWPTAEVAERLDMAPRRSA